MGGVDDMNYNDITQHCDELISVARSLQEYANAFLVIGNRSMSDALDILAVSLEDSQYHLRQTYEKDSQKEYENVVKQTGNILSALIQKGDENG
jgi:hypothetical protein